MQRNLLWLGVLAPEPLPARFRLPLQALLVTQIRLRFLLQHLQVLTALGIEHIGEVASKSICSKFGLDLVDVSFEDLISIDGIGEQMANSFLEFFRVNREFVLKLFYILKPKVTIKEEAKDNIFKNKTVVVTGTMSKSRDEIKIFLENLGAKVSSSVSKKTDFLIYGEDAGSKYDKAIELGIEILTEDEMYSKI